MRFVLTLTALALASTPVAAVTVRANGGTVSGVEGLRSPFRTGLAARTFREERFNTSTPTTCKDDPALLSSAFIYNDPQAPADPTNPSDQGGFALATGSALPGGVNGPHLPPGTNALVVQQVNNSCYAWGPNALNFDETRYPNGDPRAAIFLGQPQSLYGIYIAGDAFATTDPVTYFGMYLGSIDPYNLFGLYQVNPNPGGADDIPIIIPGLSGTDGQFNGTQLIAYLNTLGQGSYSIYGSYYIEFAFTSTENFGQIGFGIDPAARNWGIEIDNLFVSNSPSATFGATPSVLPRAAQTPEPAALALFGLGLGLIAVRRRAR